MSTNYEGLEFIAEHAATKQAHDMELRDYFAAKAMTALIVDPERADQSREECARLSYQMADAMLAARSKT